MPETVQRIETYYAGAYWGPRQESPEECARRAEVFLTALRDVDPSFSRWFRQARSRKEALTRPIEPHRAALEKLIRQGKDRVAEALGYSLRTWNGECDDYDDSGFQLDCGGSSERVPNTCVFKLPTRGPNAERVLSAPVLTRLVRSLALAWEPDCAIATSSVHMDQVTTTGRPGTFVGWIMYVPHSRGQVPLLPAPVRTEPVEDKGTLLILTPERFTAANPVHVELAQRVHELLDRAGLLGA
ncbi:MAG TPA: immunity 52 family protein [Myxococcaceae bacterium]|nr:immunity 52 family protein [Myxococcaceae bacterium]